MKKHFYSHLVEIDSIIIELEKAEMTMPEREHLLSIIESSLHHTVLDAVLSELTGEDKKRLLELMTDEKHDEIWNHLNARVDNIEGKIKDVAENLKRDLHRDIEKTTKRTFKKH